MSPLSLPGHRVPTRSQDLVLNGSPPEFSTNSPEFCGPSSNEYTFNAVNGNLRAMGMQSAIPDKHSGSGVPSTSAGRLAQYGPFVKLLTMDPLWDITREDAHILIDDWCEGLGTVYPILSRRTMVDTASKVFDSLDLVRSEGLRERGGSVVEALFDHNANKLKIVLAIGMAKLAGGREHQAQRLFQSTSEAVEGLIWNPEGIHGIQLLFLAAMYHLHLNEEVRTCRCIAFAARLCLESGLHRRSMLEKVFPNTAECTEALQAFWAVYMLERRLSLGQGIPFSIQDSYIDRSLYTIETTNPLQATLLQWTRLAGKTWHALNNQTEKSYESRVDDINYLDYQIMEWYGNLPEHLQLADSSIWTQDERYQPTYYHSILFVRKAHLRNLIYRTVLQSPVQSHRHEPTLLKAIEISKETIRTMLRLHEQTPLIRTHPMFFHQLLLTAFGNLLLAIVSTGPKIRNSAREEFDMFLHLFQVLSSKCAALRRTWHRLQGLRDLHAKLSHSDRSTQTSCLDNTDAITAGDVAVTLSFDDIFPDMPLSTMEDTVQPFNNLTMASGGLPTLNYVPENFLDLDNLFDFPFLSITSYA
ncbi:uncharacterized protein K460DRAFT_380920 [Cucurbitaria berberidis CBS 394.84]|uniref:Xylanolytic transcriptional activator regulatory domain-containing protein n=1 Tax=Cucurbitaria berberidis CBS 394.84 TaxID=1168544 RepID=A0A9P4L4D9_9PLEO|nr:uncharacterized protein K460DRAFT_380920 [Cucurbitaria berberidis CBS 394.84]KAF1841207.1 hypothetical protein K460DRAFT_380920 [Cucurbitaria berberidis CBS 394.84]